MSMILSDRSMNVGVPPDGLMSAWLRFIEVLCLCETADLLFVGTDRRVVSVNCLWFRLLFLFVISLTQDIEVLMR